MQTFNPISFHAKAHLNLTSTELQRPSIILYPCLRFFCNTHDMSHLRAQNSKVYTLTFSGLSSEASPVLFTYL